MLLVACGDERTGGVRIEAAGAGATAVSSGPPRTTARTQESGLRVAVPDGLRNEIETVLAALPAQSVGTPPRSVGEQETAEVRVRALAAADSGDGIRRQWAVAVSPHRLEVESVPLAAVVAAAQNGPLYVAEEQAALAALLFAQHDGLRPLPAELIAARLKAEGEALALVTVDRITPAIHAVAVDGIDPVRGAGDLAAYPLVTRLQVSAERGGAAATSLATALTDALARPRPAPIRLLFTGDLIPARCVYDQMRRAGDWAAPFRAVAERLRAADLTIGSLDAAISDQGTPIGCQVTFSLLAPPQVVAGFTLAGYDVITVATNHVMDCGARGPCGDRTFLDTLAHLRAAQIEPVGGGVNRAEARRPVILTAGGVRFAFLAYDDVAAYYHAGEQSAGTAPLDMVTLADDIRAARTQADVVILLPQWGEEYTPHPTARQRETARLALAAGATLIAGNHPHVVQAAMPLAGGYVAYALGNFLFDQDWSVETVEGAVMEATFHGSRLAAVRFLPVRIQNRLQPVFLSPTEGAPILKRMADAARRMGDD